MTRKETVKVREELERFAKRSKFIELRDKCDGYYTRTFFLRVIGESKVVKELLDYVSRICPFADDEWHYSHDDNDDTIEFDRNNYGVVIVIN